ncbi:MAG: fumarylacetoacetate hydrolase family protein [Clostridia bacterium]|nr:fumarylacetoacetate hydrolase family protein [Clostridia bacterium]
MKIIRALKGDEVFYAELKEERVLRLTGEPYNGISYSGDVFELSQVKVLAPCEPSKVVAVGLNYSEHAEEMKNDMQRRPDPILFIKPSSSVIGPGDDIVRPLAMSERTDYEAELGVVIGKKCRNVSPEEASDYFFGYTCVNDVTARDLQKKDGQWTRAKGFDTFCPVGPHIETELDPDHLRVQAVLNGRIMQDDTTDSMINDIYELTSFISRIMTLYPGDIIATGTPKGIAPMENGDTIEIRVEGIGSLVNKVV